MRENFAGIFRAIFRQRMMPACWLLFAATCLAQSGRSAAIHPAAHRGVQGPAHHAAAAVPVVLVSDIHFEPFWDPAKARKLAAAPVSEWRAILASAPSPDQARGFAAVERACPTHGQDTAYPLYASSLRAMRAAGAGASFVAVSGDLISHSFDCKYKAVFPHSTPEAFRSFVQKTVDYVIGELYGDFPGVPVYVALGNNDSDCGDYRMDANGAFLAATGREVTREFPEAERAGALATFAEGGYYSIALPAPAKNARLLVLNDIFMAKNYASCRGLKEDGAADEQIAWLGRQLAEARRRGQKVWVMGHIPPGVDLHATVAKMENVCGGHGPSMFLSSKKMADTMVEYGDVIQLAIFAHTHMDEIHLLRNDGSGAASGGKGVAVKMVPSISPVHGNHPSFTVAWVDPATAELKDYKVYAASNLTGAGASWNQEYDFRQSYRQSGFTAASVSKLVAGFAADPGARTQASRNYIHDFSLGYMSPVLEMFWPQYVCTLGNHTKESFRACVCSGGR